MMKTIKYGLLTLVMLMATTSCTHNDGDPNGWYGTWHIDAIESANAPYINSIILEDVDYYVQFQSSVICLRYTDVLHNGGESYGSWSEDNGVMHIEFNGNFDVSAVFPQKCELKISKHQGNKAELRHAVDSGFTTYYLTRQP